MRARRGLALTVRKSLYQQREIAKNRFSQQPVTNYRPVAHHYPPHVDPVAMPYQNQSMITFAAGQAKKMWPFIAGFGVVGYGVTVATLGITEEDKKKSGFLNPGGSH